MLTADLHTQGAHGGKTVCFRPIVWPDDPAARACRGVSSPRDERSLR